MNHRYLLKCGSAIGMTALASMFSLRSSRAQNPQAQQQVQELKQSMAANKQALLQYTWQEQQTVSHKGEVKKQQLFQVHLGPDGAPVKVPVGPQASPSDNDHGLRGHIKEKKKEEFQDYAEQIAALAHAYTQPQPGRLQALYQQGSVMIGSGGAPGLLQVVIHNYVKPGDTVTLVFNEPQHQIVSSDISSYLSDSSDAVKIAVQYAPIPGGPNHVAQMLINGVSKELTVQIQNSNYQRVSM